MVIEKEVSITGFNNLKVKFDKVEERWEELFLYHIQWSQEVLSIIAGIRNGDIRMSFKVTNATNKSTKISHVAIRKSRERRMILESSFWEETSRQCFRNGDTVVWGCGTDLQASHPENQREKLRVVLPMTQDWEGGQCFFHLIVWTMHILIICLM